MHAEEFDVVTGAFGYTGKYITRKLLSMGKIVRTLTGHPNRQNPFNQKVSIAPFDFDKPAKLMENLRGAATLYNTYWVRFAHGSVTFDQAVENTQALIEAARRANVRRIVHLSITNPSEDSPLPYFRGKAILENAIIHSGLAYAIIRPAVIFGPEGILINNIAWFLKHSPILAVPGSGDYKLQPVHVEDLAEIAVSTAHKDEDVIIDAVGPEVYTYNQLVRLIADVVQSKALIIHLWPGLVLFSSKMFGYLVKDVIFTRDEIEGLMANLLISSGPPTGKTSLSAWLKQHVETIGTHYVSELTRHYR